MLLADLAPIFVPILFPLVVAGAAALYQYLVQRSPSNVHGLVNGIAQTVVAGVEQSLLNADGTLKKQTATTMMSRILADLHIPASTDLIDMAIESAVSALTNEHLLIDARIAPPAVQVHHQGSLGAPPPVLPNG